MPLPRLKMSLWVVLTLSPMAAVAADWTGWHVGVNAGLLQTRQSFSTAPGATLLTIPFLGSRNWGSDQTEVSGNKLIAGLQGGYNWALNDKFILGIEADLQLNNQTSNKTNAFNPAGSAANTVVTNSSSTKTPWLSTLRGRAAYLPDPNLMVYGTAGLAYGEEKGKFTSSVTSGNTLVETFPYDISKKAYGYAVGGGLEWAVSRNWSFKADYTYIRLSTNRNQTIATTHLGPSALPTDILTLATSKEQINLIRLGLNYNF